MSGLVCFGLFFLAIIFIRPILLVISILTGDKETLNDVGNLCEDKIPWRDTIWTSEERGEDPLDDTPPNFKWKLGEKEGDAK